MNKMDLVTFQNGAIIDLFDEELRKVLKNIEDENTVATAERSITIKIAIKPDKKRKVGSVKVQASSTLAKANPTESFLFFDRDKEGDLLAYEDDRGPELPGIAVADKVMPFPKASNGG